MGIYYFFLLVVFFITQGSIPERFWDYTDDFRFGFRQDSCYRAHSIT